MNCLYLHIPFCRKKCHYCSFNSRSGQEHLFQRYCRALQKEVGDCRPKQPLDTLFVGGGTPTLLPAGALVELLDTIGEHFGFSEDAEISIEANPETVELQTLRDLRRSGFNRVSLGIQSFADAELEKLGRIHSAARAQKAIEDAGRAGFSNLSIDLMYGLPGQDPASWRRTLGRALEPAPSHLSAYQLSIEAHTGFGRLADSGSLDLPGEDAIADMDEATRELCGAAGLDRYEISNFSRPGFQCRHNLNYWRNDSYLACGAGAVSFIDGERAARIRDPEDYCRAVEQGAEVIAMKERLNPRDSFKETVIMGLRLVGGISIQRLQKRYGLAPHEVYGAELERLIEQNLVGCDDSTLVLTGRGMQFANQVMAILV